MNTRKRLLPHEVIWYFLVFSFFLIWFTQVHPLTVYDADDWVYISYPRRAIPIWTYWNPSRIFPEIFMPLCSTVAAHLVYPLVGNYLRAMTLTHGFVVSVFLTVYTGFFARMMKRLFQLPPLAELFSSCLFLIAHFLILRTYQTDNTYLFYCWDLTCYYYYLIPAVVNTCLVMWMIGNPRFPDFLKTTRPDKMGLFLLLLYLAVFSNLPDSGILATYAGAVLLLNGLKLLKNKSDWKAFFRENFFFLAVFGMWLISAILELMGGRANSHLVPHAPLLQRLLLTVQGLGKIIFRCNPIFFCACFLIVAASLIVLLRSRATQSEDRSLLSLMPLCLLCCAAMVFYTLFLCTAVDSSYISRSEYLFGLLFYLILFVMLLFGYLLQKLPCAMYVVPLMLCVLLSECNTLGVTYLESNMSNLPPAVSDELMQELIDQVLAAEEAGLDSVTIEMPLCDDDSGGNWPLSVKYLGKRIVDSLNEHGVLRRKIDVTLIPSMEVNWSHSLPILE